MFYTRCPSGPTEMLAGVALAFGVFLGGVGAAAAERPGDEGAEYEAGCRDHPCVVVEYEENVAVEAARLAETLRIRLSPRGVRVIAEEYGAREAESPAAENAMEQDDDDEPRLLWVVHFRSLSSNLFFVAIDNRIGAGAEDLVREVARGDNTESALWTISLMIEEIVLPYVDRHADQPAVGAGLAIIEPPAVGGIAKPEPSQQQAFPRLHLIGLGMVVTGIVAAGDFAIGPVVSFEGLFAPKFLAYVSAGWSGFVEYSKGDIRGRAQYVPLEIALGYRMYSSRAIELSAWTGLALGFAAYGTESRSGVAKPRTDVLFEPGIIAALRLSFTVYGPLAFYLVGGITVSLVRDALENRGTTVYTSGWVSPDVELGAQLKF
jgi:hypothetical protein